MSITAKLYGYGYSSWNGNEGIVSFTNPTDEEQTYSLQITDIVGAKSTLKDVTGVQVYPYAEGNIENTLSYGDTITVTLKPHQTIIQQYGHVDNEKPGIVLAKATGNNEITLKFSERIQGGTYIVAGEEVTAELKEDFRTVVWQDIKEINTKLPKYKYMKKLILTDEPMIKTTTQKVKRFEEMKKINK